jgi:predicted nucleotide-binding protein
MARINQELLERLQTKLRVSRSRVYALIDEKVRSAALPRHLAAIAVAAERGVSISRYASQEDLTAIRQSRISSTPVHMNLPLSNLGVKPLSGSRRKVKRGAKFDNNPGTTVFVVHGRNLRARDAVFAFLRSIGLRPLEWTQALKLTKKGTPYVGEVLDAAFRMAAAIVVLLTPDDEARLRIEFITSQDPKYEKELTGQARPNVLFEAGMSFGKNPKSTVLVQLGGLRPFSDIGGRHVHYLRDSPESRREFVTKLSNAGCIVDTSGTDWMSAGDFGPSSLPATALGKTKKR